MIRALGLTVVVGVLSLAAGAALGARFMLALIDSGPQERRNNTAWHGGVA